MTRVDFAFGAPDRLRMACDVARRHFEAGRRVIVYTQDAPRLARFDRLLWGFKDTAFIPHVAVDDPLAASTPVLLAGSAEELDQAGSLLDEGAPAGSEAQGAWLLNLDLQCPPGPERFGRILEIVSNHEKDKEAARERWKQYQGGGHDVRAHDVSNRAPRD